MFVAKNGSFLEREFLSKELSGRKIELDKVVEPYFNQRVMQHRKMFSVEPTSVE